MGLDIEVVWAWDIRPITSILSDLNPEFDDSALSIPPGVLGESE
jgi:hypothetical protein